MEIFVQNDCVSTLFKKKKKRNKQAKYIDETITQGDEKEREREKMKNVSPTNKMMNFF